MRRVQLTGEVAASVNPFEDLPIRRRTPSDSSREHRWRLPLQEPHQATVGQSTGGAPETDEVEIEEDDSLLLSVWVRGSTFDTKSGN